MSDLCCTRTLWSFTISFFHIIFLVYVRNVCCLRYTYWARFCIYIKVCDGLRWLWVVDGIFAKKLLIAFYSLAPDLCDSGTGGVWDSSARESEWEKRYKVFRGVGASERGYLFYTSVSPDIMSPIYCKHAFKSDRQPASFEGGGTYNGCRGAIEQRYTEPDSFLSS